MFIAEDLVWHDSVEGGPSNHLLDSQVQCVNALAPGLSDPAFVRDVFRDVLPIDEVLEVEPGRYLTFEYIGAIDHLGERKNLPRTRGSLTTSADAAIRYRTPQGAIEMALIEWKYTEDYRDRELAPPRGLPRADRYRPLWDAPDCPIRRDLIPYEDLFVEPFYQLFRQQLLVWSMEQAHELDASKVRVVHLCPIANDGVHHALNRPSHLEAGDDTLEIWSRMCVDGDRFITLDSQFVMPARDANFQDRYVDHAHGL